MALKKHEDFDWQEGYINNVWCKFKTLLSPKGDLFVVARKDYATRVFMLKKEIIEKNKDDEFNSVMGLAEDVPLSKIPRFIRKFM